MKFPQPNGLRIALLTCIICVQTSFAFAQIIDPENSPLDCVTYITENLSPDDIYFQGQIIAARISKLGRFEQALSIVKKTPCPGKSLLANFLAKQALESNNFEYTDKFIQEVLSCESEEILSVDRGIFVETVSQLLRLKKFDQAFSVSELIVDYPTTKARALTKIAEAKIDLGLTAQANILLNRAISETNNSDEDEPNRVEETLSRIAVQYARLGIKSAIKSTIDEAIRIAEKDEYYRNTLKSHIAITYAQCGLLFEAEQMAKSLPQDEKRGALIYLARFYSTKNQKSKAIDLLNKVIKEAESSGADYEYYKISEIHLLNSAPQQAINLLKRIDGNYNICDAAKFISEWCLKHEEQALAVEAIDIAFEKIRKIVSEKNEEISGMLSTSKAMQKAQYLSQLTDLYLQANDFDKARQCIKEIELPQHRANKLADLAAVMNTSNENSNVAQILIQALELSKTAPEHRHDRQQNLTLCNIARRLAETGNSAQSLELFTKLLAAARDDDDRLEYLAEIGINFELSGLKVDANIREILREIIKLKEE